MCVCDPTYWKEKEIMWSIVEHLSCVLADMVTWKSLPCLVASLSTGKKRTGGKYLCIHGFYFMLNKLILYLLFVKW